MKGTRLELSNAELGRMNSMFRGKLKEINAEANKGLKEVAMLVQGAAIKNIERNGSQATGQLINSIKIRDRNDLTIDVAAEADHAYWVEFGRKAGGIPPIKPILEWVKKKQIADTFSIKTHKQVSRGAAKAYTNKKGKEVKQSDYYKKAIGIAIAIAKSIGKQGTKARPFLYPAMREFETEMMIVINRAIKKVI